MNASEATAFIWTPPLRILRQFGVIWLPLAVLLIGARLMWPSPLALGSIAVVAAALSLMSAMRPRAAWPLWVMAMLVARPIGAVVSTAALAVVYFLVLSPLALVLRRVRPDPLRRTLERSSASYWSRRPAPPPPARYFREF